MVNAKLLPKDCENCMLRPVFCDIDRMLELDASKWLPFATECGKHDAMDRIFNVEKAGLNKFDRGKILDETYGFFFSPSLLFFPFETVKRVLTDKFDKVFPEFNSEPASKHIKWTLRMEVISKFCQLAEILAGHMVASEKVGPNYQSYKGYTSQLIEYKVDDAVQLFQRISKMSDENLARIMCYPDKEKQSRKGKELLEESLVYLKTDLSIIGEEYIKFKELYNAYKHGCRLLHPETTTIDRENFAAFIIYLTKKTSPKRGGMIQGFGFPNDDFSSFFNLVENIGRILGVMTENRRQRYLLANKLSSEISVALYFPKLMDGLIEAKDIVFSV